MAFKTQYSFRLPRGFVDENGNVHRDGVMRLATARDEILPLQDYRVQSNRAYLVIVLLSRVITQLGEHRQVTVDMIENLFSTDLAYLQEFYRKINERGLKIERTVSHGNAFGCYFRDPEENIVEVYWHTGKDYPQPYGDPIDLSAPDEELLKKVSDLQDGLPHNTEMPAPANA